MEKLEKLGECCRHCQLLEDHVCMPNKLQVQAALVEAGSDIVTGERHQEVRFCLYG